MLAWARRSGVSSATINDIEKARQMPAADTIERLARALGLRPCWLAFGDGPPKVATTATALPPEGLSFFSKKSGG